MLGGLSHANLFVWDKNSQNYVSLCLFANRDVEICGRGILCGSFADDGAGIWI